VRKAVAVVAAALLAAGVASCDPCAGTPWCHVYPEVSYGGQFIERTTGREVAGVRVTFVRVSGVDMPIETLTVVSDAGGFFQLRGPTHAVGSVVGRLEVVPPPPHSPYVVPTLRLTASDVRGEGVQAGRLVVDPYSFYLGEIYDRRVKRPVGGVTVTMRLLDGPVAAPDSAQFITDAQGRFLFEPTLSGYGVFRYDVSLAVPGDTATYRFPLRITPEYMDHVPVPRLIPIPRVIRYQLEVSRRGTGEFLPGVQLRFVRTGGIRVQPETLTATLAAGAGRFTLYPTPLEDGELVGDLTITPPAPFAVEVVRDLRLRVDYSDSVYFLDVYGYGPQVYLHAKLLNRADDLPVKRGTVGIVKRVSGLTFLYPSWANPAADSGIRNVDSLGNLPYVAATPDTGSVTFDFWVRWPGAGFTADTVRAVTVPARNSSAPTARGPFRVGPWYPWYGEVRDVDTDAPIAGATVKFQRTSGADMQPATVTMTTGADGRFRVTAMPRSAGSAIGTLTFTFAGGTYRDSTYAGAQLTATQDDTLRLLRVFRFRRQ